MVLGEGAGGLQSTRGTSATTLSHLSRVQSLSTQSVSIKVAAAALGAKQVAAPMPQLAVCDAEQPGAATGVVKGAWDRVPKRIQGTRNGVGGVARVVRVAEVC